MELDLSPKLPQQVFSGDGGSYYSWSSSEFPILGESKVGGGKLVLDPLGLALPHYSDSTKIGFVLQGSGIVGMVISGSSDEKVVRCKKGDAIPVPLAAVSWWFNDGDSEFVVVFLGETSKAYTPGEFTYFLLAGTKGIFTGFSTEFVSRAFNLNEEESNKIVKSQPGVLIVKLNEVKNIPEPRKADTEAIIFNFDAAHPDFDTKNGGSVVYLTKEKLGLVGQVGLSASLVKLEANALFAPGYSSDSGIQVIYIVKGSGRVEIVGVNSELVLNTEVKAGQLYVVPRFFVVSKIADGEGMDWFSIITTTQPIFSKLAGKASIWTALSPQVVQASLNLTPKLKELFISKMRINSIFFPPPPPPY